MLYEHIRNCNRCLWSIVFDTFLLHLQPLYHSRKIYHQDEFVAHQTGGIRLGLSLGCNVDVPEAPTLVGQFSPGFIKLCISWHCHVGAALLQSPGLDIFFELRHTASPELYSMIQHSHFNLSSGHWLTAPGLDVSFELHRKESPELHSMIQHSDFHFSSGNWWTSLRLPKHCKHNLLCWWHNFEFIGTR